MTQVETLRYALDELSAVVAALDASEMDTVTNCAAWTVRQLASHAVNNQLLWAGIVTGKATVSSRTRGCGAHEGDLGPSSRKGLRRALAMWSTEGVLEGTHATPLGELPGSIVILLG